MKSFELPLPHSQRLRNYLSLQLIVAEAPPLAIIQFSTFVPFTGSSHTSRRPCDQYHTMAADQLGPATAWWRDPGLRTLYLLLPIVILSSSYQGFDGMIMNGLQLLPSWQKGPQQLPAPPFLSSD